MGNEAINIAEARGGDAAAELKAAIAHHRARRYDEAETIYRRLLDAVPGHPRALHLLGVVETQRGKVEHGLELIQQASSALGDAPDLHFDLGNAFRLAGKREEAAASFRRAIALKPDYPTAHMCLASVLGELGKFEAAIGHCRAAIAINPKSIPVRVVLANALRGASRLPEAAQVWRELIELEPERAESYYQLGVQLSGLGLFKEALSCCDRAIALQPSPIHFHLLQGGLLLRLYDGERAEASFRRALELSPDSKEGLAGLSWTLRMLGRFDEADTCTKRLHELDPKDLRDVRHVPSTGNQLQGEGEMERLASVLDDAGAKVDSRVTAGFALGRLLDDAGDYDKAFSRYAAANNLVRQNSPTRGDAFDAKSFTRTVNVLIASNTPQTLANEPSWGNMSELPVFIVGMPRSGTTLVEQICASHSRVHGAGELDALSRVSWNMVRERRRGSELAEIGRRLADQHVLHLHRLGQGALRVVDKMPDNILLIPLITRLFPRARIIYCSRDPRDVSLSCYFQLFADGAQLFSYNLADCGSRCRDVQRLAAHWQKLRPHHMIEVNYETLVADLEGESRRVIDFLGLPWEPACLEFHRTERTVATISHWQVRQPIYSSSIGRWRKYEKHLAPLFAALDDPREAPAQSQHVSPEGNRDAG